MLHPYTRTPLLPPLPTPAPEDGVHIFSLSFGLSCLVSLALSPCMPWAIRKCGNRAVWGASQLLLAALTFAQAALPSMNLTWEEPPGVCSAACAKLETRGRTNGPLLFSKGITTRAYVAKKVTSTCGSETNKKPA